MSTASRLLQRHRPSQGLALRSTSLFYLFLMVVLPMLAMIFRAPPAAESTLESALAEMSEAMTRAPAAYPVPAET